jgi:hypothetical protein
MQSYARTWRREAVTSTSSSPHQSPRRRDRPLASHEKTSTKKDEGRKEGGKEKKKSRPSGKEKK